MQLQFAFSLCQNNVVNLLTKLYAGGVRLPSGDRYTASDFAKEWELGGKKFIENKWRDPANKSTGHFISDEGSDEDTVREMWQGKHEWIPTNMLGYIIENACIIHQDIKWAYLAEVLRTPTRYVIVKKSKLSYPEQDINPMGFVGHVGALYVTTGTQKKALTKGQSTFHDELRGILKRWLSSATNEIHTYVQKLQVHIREWYWQGDMLTPEFFEQPCPYLYLSGSKQYTAWGDTMGEMAMVLTQGWALWNQVMSNQIKAMNYM
jgi:hypothetical protein